MTKHHSTKGRPETVATPQDNTEARLTDSNGQPKNPKAEAIATLSERLKARFSFAIPDSDDGAPTGDSDLDTGGLSFSKAFIAELKSNHSSDLTALIAEARGKGKACEGAGKKLLLRWFDGILAWASPFRSSENITLVNEKGSSVVLAEKEFENSMGALLLSLAKISNTSLYGKSGKIEKSIFRSPEKLAKIKGFRGGNTQLEAHATVRHVVTDKGGLIIDLFKLIGTAANQFNQRDWNAGAETLRTLIGENPTDKRFALPFDMVFDLVQGRFYGYLASTFYEQERQAKDALKPGKSKKLPPMSEGEKAALDAYQADIAEARAKALAESRLRADSERNEKLERAHGISPNGMLQTFQRELDEQKLLPETSDDVSVELRNASRVRYLEAQIELLNTVESPDSTETEETEE